MSEALTGAGIDVVGMEEADIAHLAGVIDGIGNGAVTVQVTKSDSYDIGYQYKPVVRFHRAESDAALLGKIDAYCEQQHVQYKLKERTDTASRLVFEIIDLDSIKRFLEPLMPYLVTVHYNAALVLEDVIPAIRNERHTNKQGFYDLMSIADELRSGTTKGREPKYTKDYFAEQWEDEITTA